MPRVKRGTKRKKRRSKILKQAKGYWGARSHNYKTAKEAVEKALQYSYRDRRNRKRDFRRLWITRINAAANSHGISYSQFMKGLKKKDIDLNRKILAELAATSPDTFSQIVKEAKKA
ncbi:MAG: 50S ribosomal protein L20 [Candidatus Aminicenantes bacterium]|nr:50S ribosomal protein L20 [Candidatus Aminicenantes bacterium]